MRILLPRKYLFPIDTRRRYRRLIDVETTSCVYWVVIIISSSETGNSSSSCSRSGGASSSGSDSTSGCGSSGKILTWTGKYKLGAIAGSRVGKYNLRYQYL